MRVFRFHSDSTPRPRRSYRSHTAQRCDHSLVAQFANGFHRVHRSGLQHANTISRLEWRGCWWNFDLIRRCRNRLTHGSSLQRARLKRDKIRHKFQPTSKTDNVTDNVMYSLFKMPEIKYKRDTRISQSKPLTIKIDSQGIATISRGVVELLKADYLTLGFNPRDMSIGLEASTISEESALKISRKSDTATARVSLRGFLVAFELQDVKRNQKFIGTPDRKATNPKVIFTIEV
jgi:hypothetical protein